jgi:glycine/D-amino acid oxidase-like deaminating enzyme
VSGEAIVVGAGAFGAAAADALARRGWGVTVVEQYAPANARGSSGDRTRMLRLGHGDNEPAQDGWYIASAARGIAGWKALSVQDGADLLVKTGLVWFARDDDTVERRVAERLTDAGVSCERLDPAGVRALFPGAAVDDLAYGLWEPEAYVMRATAGVEALLRRARRHGARLVTAQARPAGPRAVAVDGGELAGDCVVWACGAWMGALLGPVAPVRPAWQDVLHWNAPGAWRDGPAWFDVRERVYGFPDVDGLGLKAVTHEPGRPFDVDGGERVPDAAAVASMRAYLARRFPGLGDPTLLWGRVMPYEMTPDGHFLVGAHPERPGEWILGGGSGHGFKHAPALGEHLAELIEGREDPVPMLAPGPRDPR